LIQIVREKSAEHLLFGPLIAESVISNSNWLPKAVGGIFELRTTFHWIQKAAFLICSISGPSLLY
jgi:hypothetical protein